MKVLLRRNVSKLGQIGDVVTVKPGYARNYLLPEGLAIAPTEANLKAVDADKQRYLAEVARKRAELEKVAEKAQDKEVTISARANEEGHLYGSVGPAQICAALTEEGVFVEPSMIRLAEPIRQLDKHDVVIEFDEGITATVYVWVVPVREAGEEEPIEPPATEATEIEESAEESSAKG